MTHQPRQRPYIVEIATPRGKIRQRSSPSRGVNFVLSPGDRDTIGGRVAVTHKASGYKAANNCPRRAAEILCCIYDRIFLADTVDGIFEEYKRLPRELQRWCRHWLHGWPDQGRKRFQP